MGWNALMRDGMKWTAKEWHGQGKLAGTPQNNTICLADAEMGRAADLQGFLGCPDVPVGQVPVVHRLPR